MKKALFVSVFVAALAILPACRSGNGVTENGEVIRKAAVVSVYSDALEDKAKYGKTFWIVPTVEKEYNKECSKSFANGLNYLGYREAASKAKADFIVEFSYDSVDGRRRDTSVKVKFIRNSKERDVLWNASSKCSSRKDVEIKGLLPGLTAGALLFVGRSTHSRTKLANFPAMVNAVEGK